jgi:hypothetical protein
LFHLCSKCGKSLRVLLLRGVQVLPEPLLLPLPVQQPLVLELLPFLQHLPEVLLGGTATPTATPSRITLSSIFVLALVLALIFLVLFLSIFQITEYSFFPLSKARLRSRG